MFVHSVRKLSPQVSWAFFLNASPKQNCLCTKCALQGAASCGTSPSFKSIALLQRSTLKVKRIAKIFLTFQKSIASSKHAILNDFDVQCKLFVISLIPSSSENLRQCLRKFWFLIPFVIEYPDFKNYINRSVDNCKYFL